MPRLRTSGGMHDGTAPDASRVNSVRTQGNFPRSASSMTDDSLSVAVVAACDAQLLLLLRSWPTPADKTGMRARSLCMLLCETSAPPHPLPRMDFRR